MVGRGLERRESKGLSAGFGGDWVKGSIEWVQLREGEEPIDILGCGIIPL